MENKMTENSENVEKLEIKKEDVGTFFRWVANNKNKVWAGVVLVGTLFGYNMQDLDLASYFPASVDVKRVENVEVRVQAVEKSIVELQENSKLVNEVLTALSKKGAQPD